MHGSPEVLRHGAVNDGVDAAVDEGKQHEDDVEVVEDLGRRGKVWLCYLYRGKSECVTCIEGLGYVMLGYL